MRGGAGTWELSCDQMRQRMRQIRHRIDLLEIEFSELAFAFAGTGEHLQEGSLTAADSIRHDCKLGHQAAWDRLRVGEEMNQLSATVQAVEAGEIGFQHLVLMARTKQAVKKGRGGAPFDEAGLLEEARDSSVGRFWHVCQHVRHAADPDGMADQELQNRERRRLSVRPCEDGMVSVGGLLDPVGGAALRTALQPLSRKSGAGDERTLEQRLADALVDMAKHALDVNPVRSRPHLNVTANLGTLYRIPGSAGGEMDMAPPVGSDTVQRIACDCSIGRVLFEGESLIVDLGRAKRVVSPATRRALDARDHHCRWPGCERPGTWCEAHHVVHWIHGGPTDLTNLVLLCYRHHMMVHEGRWKLVLYPDGRLEVIKPPLDFLAWARGPTLAA